MTSAEFNARYQLVKQVTEGAVCTYHAVASTGAVVMVHILDPGAQDENRVLVELLGSLDPAERPRILDVDEVDGATVIITRFILDFPSLRGWLEAHTVSERAVEAPPPQAHPPQTPQAPPRETAAPREQPESTKEPGEFTRLFRPPSVESEPAKQAEAPAAKRETKEPGEFTRMFRTQQPEAGKHEETRTPPSPAEPVKGEPGEFTRKFAAQARPEPPAPPPVREDPEDRTRVFASDQPPRESPFSFPDSPAPKKTEGEFTRIMRAAASPQDTPPSPAPSAPAPPPPVQPQVPSPPLPPPPAAQRPAEGEFTRMFGAQSPPAPQQPPPPFGTPHSGMTGRFAAPGQGGKARSSDEYLSKLDASQPAGPSRDDPLAAWGNPGAGQPPAAPRPSGAGEYTRIISAVPPAPEPARAPPPPPPPPKPDKMRPWLIGGLIAIAVLAVILVLVFALAGGGSDPAPASPPDSSAPAAAGR